MAGPPQANPPFVIASNADGNWNEQTLVWAVGSFDRALELAPGYAEVYYLRSVLHHRLQRDDAALGDALHAQALRYPVDPRWIETLQK